MKRFLLTFLTVAATILNAQAPDTAWTRNYDRAADDCRWIEETADSGFVLAGFSQFPGGPLEIYLVRSDVRGDTLWTRNYGDSPIGQKAFCVREDWDGGFVIAGLKYMSTTLRNAWIIKTDSNGDTLWTQYFGGTRNAGALHVSCTNDSGYIVTGQKYDPGEFSNAFLLKLNKDGETEWARTFGGAGYEEGYAVQQTNEGGYMMAGSKDVAGRSQDFYLVKTDSSGVLEWDKTHGGDSYDHCTSAQQASDGGYILYGQTNSFIPISALAVKTDAIGDTMWTRVFKRSNGDYGWAVDETADGGFIFGGYGNIVTHLDDFWFVRTDVNGDTLWQTTVGHGNYQRAWSGLQTSDGGYVLAGYSLEGGPTSQDFFVVKLNPSSTGINNRPMIARRFTLRQNYPNPFNPVTNVEFGLRNAQWVSLVIHDVLGRPVKTLVDERRAAGNYLVQWDGRSDQGGKVSSGI